MSDLTKKTKQDSNKNTIAELK